MSLIVGLGLAGVMISRVVAGVYEIERRAILNDYRLASATPLNARRLAAFAEDLSERLPRLDARNQPLARVLAARSRLASAQDTLERVLANADAPACADAFDALELALDDEALVDSLGEDDARALADAGLPELDRDVLARRLEADHRRAARLLAALDDPLGAWRHLRLIAQGGGFGAVAIAPLASRVDNAREAWLAAYLAWLAEPERGGAVASAAWADYELLWDDFSREARFAAGLATPARRWWREHEGELAAREKRLALDIAEIEGGALPEAEERARLARLFGTDEVDAALKLSAEQRAARLADRRAALAREVRGRREAAESLGAFEHMCDGLADSGPGLEQVRALLTGSPSLKQRLLDPAGARAGELVREYKRALMADAVVLAADLHQRRGGTQQSRALLKELGESLARVAALAGYLPGRMTRLPPALTGPGAPVEFALLADALAALDDQMSRAPTPALRALGGFERTLTARVREAMLEGSYALARHARDEHAAALRRLTGPARPAADAIDVSTGRRELEVAEDEARRLREEALRALETFARLDEPRVSHRARLAAAGVLIDDLRYRYEFCYWLDPRGLGAFARHGESPEGARARLHLGPPADMRRRAAQWLAELEGRVSFAADPQSWVAIRLRKGQLRELTPQPRPQPGPFAGDFAGAVRETYLPLLSSADVAASQAAENEALPLAEFLAGYRRKLELVLDYLSPASLETADLAEIEAVLACVGEPRDHTALLEAAARLLPFAQARPTAARVYRRGAQLQGARQALLLKAGRVEEAGRAGALARAYFAGAARTLLQGGVSDSALWAEVGADLLAAGEHAQALIALKRYFASRAGRRGDGVTLYEAARALGEAYEAVEAYGGAENDPAPGRLNGAIDAYLFAAREARAVLARTGELPAPALGVFTSLARARYRCGLAEGRPEQFRAAIDELEAHILKGEIFKAPPRDLDSSSAWRDAQYYRGLCALELARLQRLADPPEPGFERELDLAFVSFDDVVQRFFDQRNGITRDAQYRAAYCEFMRACFHPRGHSRAGLDPLRRAAQRLEVLREEAAEGDEALRALVLHGDVLELLGRRLFDLLAQDTTLEPTEGRAALQGAIVAFEAVGRDYPHSYQAAWALSQRIQALRTLGRHAPAELERARELVAAAPAVLDRVSDEQWKLAPRDQRRAYWDSYFEWAR